MKGNAPTLAHNQSGPLARLLDALMTKLVAGIDAEDLECRNLDPEGERQGPKYPYCGCYRCDIGLIERYLLRVTGEGELLAPIHFGAMAVVDYIAATRGVPRPFTMAGLQRHQRLCGKCRAAHQMRQSGPHPVSDASHARAQVTQFLSRAGC